MLQTLQRLLVVIFLLISSQAMAIQKVFYTLRHENIGDYGQVSALIESIKQHHRSIDLLIPQAYQLDEDGIVWGMVNSRLQKAAKQYGIHIMPLVTNVNFDQERLTLFLNSPQAQSRSINSLLTLCQRNHYDGIQIDFEHVPVKVGHSFTQYYQQLATVMHQHGFQISLALFPLAEELPSDNVLKHIYAGWSGGFEYPALAKSSDFISLMAYDQHGGITTPGPNAGLPWVNKITKYALKSIPANKLLLGMPSFSLYWKTQRNKDKTTSNGIAIDYDTVQGFLDNYKIKLIWEDTQKVHYAFYAPHQFNEFLFVEDKASFAAKIELAKKYKLRGFSVWRLGMEDPKIWDIIDSLK